MVGGCGKILVMRDNSFECFCVGLVTGALLLVVILTVLHMAPHQVEKKWQADMVERGYGRYIVDTNTLTVKFEWNSPALELESVK